MTRVLLALLGFYKRWLSPALHKVSLGGCKYLPTCSEYAQIALLRHGAFYGSLLAVWRVLRCNPFSRGGVDEVPLPRENKPNLVQ
jgi:putative membrane protein insertion efficiency factor